MLPTSNGDVIYHKGFDGELLTGIPRGTWVAISADQSRIAGKGETIEEALAQARESGETQPIIMRIPLDDYLIL